LDLVNQVKVRFKKLKDTAHVPQYGTEYAAGADLYACMEEPLTIAAGTTAFVHTGLAMEIPAGLVGLVYARSGLACKKGLAPANKVGVVDSDYRGEIMVALHNHSQEDITIDTGERVAQMVIAPYVYADYEETEKLEETVRGSGGFGSTGMK
jgi:dUTP pyrophosphatase